ncbi:hypothetical protein [Aliamphritea hakodatensis]|uniref:hypothetical protein n=1 Tax=Aliamphritea hakodatensis TaxID=2895352 RepID=UPI0022FD5B9A|nr:hypothetical protein [Aliamphritea hakodatensis]
MDDIIQSFKAYMYDRIASPLVGSLIAAWLISNYKLILIAFSGGADLKEKLDNISLYFSEIEIRILDWYTFTMDGYLYHNFVVPAYFVFLYIVMFPYIAKPVYQLSLKNKKKLKEARDLIQEETLLTLEESRQYIITNRELQEKYTKDMREKEREIEAYMKKNTGLQALIKQHDIQTGISNSPDENIILDANPSSDLNNLTAAKITERLNEKLGNVLDNYNGSDTSPEVSENDQNCDNDNTKQAPESAQNHEHIAASYLTSEPLHSTASPELVVSNVTLKPTSANLTLEPATSDIPLEPVVSDATFKPTKLALSSVEVDTNTSIQQESTRESDNTAPEESYPILSIATAPALKNLSFYTEIKKRIQTLGNVEFGLNDIFSFQDIGLTDPIEIIQVETLFNTAVKNREFKDVHAIDLELSYHYFKVSDIETISSNPAANFWSIKALLILFNAPDNIATLNSFKALPTTPQNIEKIIMALLGNKLIIKSNQPNIIQLSMKGKSYIVHNNLQDFSKHLPSLKKR